MPTRPNILVLICDDLGYADLGCYGGTLTPTPRLDALAASGVRCTDFHSSGVVCSPTRAALLTGMDPRRTGITGVVTAVGHRHVGLDPALPTLPRLLGQAGYASACFGKWHLGYEPRFGPRAHGFGRFRGFVSGNIDYHSHVDQTGRVDWWIGERLQDEPGYATDLIADHACAFIRDHAAGGDAAPFLLYLAFPAPHYPYQGPSDPPERTVGGTFATHGKNQHDPVVYATMIAALDAAAGRVMDALEATGQRENTLILFTSDHGAPAGLGGASNGPWRGGKGQLAEGGHRVAGLLSWPIRIATGQVRAELCSTVDLSASILDAAGLTPPADWDGRSLLPAFAGDAAWESPVLHWSFAGRLARREGDWKLLREADGSERLYDLAVDPGEARDLAASYPARAAAMAAGLAAWDAELARRSPPPLA